MSKNAFYVNATMTNSIQYSCSLTNNQVVLILFMEGTVINFLENYNLSR